MKKKLNFILRIRKEFYKGFLRFYFFIEVIVLKYVLYQSRKDNYKKLNIISLLCPTKNRSIKFKRFAESLIKKTNNLSRIELLICFDLKEEEINLYEKEFLKLESNGVIIKKFFQNLNSHALRNNFLAKNSTGSIIFPVNDDLIILSNNWDKILDHEFSKNNPSKPLCVWINCDRKYKNLDYSAFPVINNSWFNRLGYIVPEYFRFWYLEWWICEVSRLSKKYFLSKVTIHQFHAETYENEKDAVYKKNATTENLEHDYRMWLKTKNYRIKDSIKIKS